MKKLYYFSILSILIFVLQSCIVSSKPNISYLNDLNVTKSSAQVVAVNVPMWLAKPYVKKALRQDKESQEVIDLVKKIKKIKVMTLNNPQQELVSNINNKLKAENFEEWVTVKSDGDNVRINVQQDKETVKKMLLMVHSKNDKEMVLVDIKADISPEHLNKIIAIYQE